MVLHAVDGRPGLPALARRSLPECGARIGGGEPSDVRFIDPSGTFGRPGVPVGASERRGAFAQDIILRRRRNRNGSLAIFADSVCAIRKDLQ